MAPAHHPALLLPGAILKLPVWGDAAAENCFEDDIYWEVSRAPAEALRRRSGAEAGGGSGAGRHKMALSPRGAEAAVSPRRCRRTRRATRTTCTTPTSPPRPDQPTAPRRPPPRELPPQGGGGAARHLPAGGAAPAASSPATTGPRAPLLEGVKARFLPVTTRHPAWPFSAAFVMSCCE